ncbi:MAG: hypothetical protein IJH32_08200 [Ruminococcus sp.]|nr:hypothetical protein [Ruminococcus sp.]
MPNYRICDLNVDIAANYPTMQKNIERYRTDYEAEPNISLFMTDDLLLEMMEESEGATADTVETIYLSTLFCWDMFDFNGFPIRAVAVEYEDKAVLFASPFDESVDLKALLPEKIVFDYNYPMVRIENDKYFVHDTPFGFDGHLSKHPRKLELASVVFVDTKEFDTLKKLESKDFVRMFMRAVALNIRHERTKHTLFVLEKLMHKTQFFGVSDVSDIRFILERVI